MPIVASCSRDILVLMLFSLSFTEEILQVALGATFLIFELAVIYLVLGKFNLSLRLRTDSEFFDV
jgi:hypothetical protein